MGFFGKLGRKIDTFVTKVDTKIHRNVDKFIEDHAHHGSEPAHNVSKRSVDVADDIGMPPTPCAPTYMREARDGQSILVGCIAEPDHQAIGL